jgi:peptide subunit release factor RF-3
MTNFGVELFLKDFLQLAQSPPARPALVQGWGGNHASTANPSAPSGAIDATMGDVASSARDAALSTSVVQPSEQEFSGFVFKLQANLDPKHRDRMAFVRICSGVFRKGMKVQHSRLQRSLSLSSAQNLFAQDREEVTTAYPGDVIGIHNPGVFAIGDTIYTGSGSVAYPGIPSFSPERFAYIRNPNPSVYKKFQKVRSCGQWLYRVSAFILGALEPLVVLNLLGGCSVSHTGPEGATG